MDSPESYLVVRPSPNIVIVEGSDEVGAMYGALDVAEQISAAGEGDSLGGIKPISRSPFLLVRGVNMFLTAQGFDDPNSWYWSDAFWAKFLDMLARDRYNFLDFHGPFDLTVGWPNGFSYFVNLKEFPEVGVGPERAAKNLNRFRLIIRMAADRGIKVGFMNYTAAAPIGPWQTGKFWVDERYVPRPQQYLTGPRLEEYTRLAVKTFLAQVPDLWMFGFRIGESGQPEDFYKKTYVAAVKGLPKSLNLYARTWLAAPAKVREIARLTDHKFFIEPKYNGEQLGLPYQAATGGRQYAPSGSYEDYTDYPRNYSIIWQIRANGTHRIFHWGMPEFARRTVRSCKFGGGIGFSMEPMNAYYPQTDYFHNNARTNHKFYDWVFEQQWFWYQLWGRTAYDPEVSDRVWLGEFELRFGPRAGQHVFKALAESGKIVPFIYSYHNQGLDHQDMAPEYEIGDHAQSARGTIWQGNRLVPFGGGNDDYLNVGVLDRTAMADPATYARDYLAGAVSGRMTPFQAGRYLEEAADVSLREADEAEKLNPSSSSEFECIKMDIEAVAWLGRYYANRIASATHLQLYKLTYHHPELTSAHEYLQRAVQSWDRLAAVTEEHFAYVPELIRMRVYKFRWRDEGRSLGADLEEINRLEAEYQALEVGHRRSIIGHVPPPKLKPGHPFTVTATLATAGVDPHVYLFYRNSAGGPFHRVPLHLQNRFERTWTGEVPAESVTLGHLEYYFEADSGVGGAYSGTLQYRPPYSVFVNDDELKPIITHAPPRSARAPSVKLVAEVKDGAKVRFVRVYYKSTGAQHEWLMVDMRETGDHRYEADVPITPEGILYYFEAADENGNASNYPDFLKQTPYFVLDGWEAK
jgi:hypothetical protein